MGVIEQAAPVTERLRTPSRRLLKRLAIASLVSNIVIVVTGGAVRLTASGLGCPTWPRCTDDSFVTAGRVRASTASSSSATGC